MEPNQGNYFVQYLLFPSIVALFTSFASGIATYFATYQLQKKSKDEEQGSKVRDLVSKLLIELNRIIPLFEKLNSDFDKENYFSFANIDLITNAKWRFLNLANEVTILEEGLRKEILESGDRVSTLIDEVNAIERNPVQGHTDLKTKLEDAIREDRHLKIELLKLDIFLKDVDGILVPHYLTREKENKKTTATPEINPDQKLQVISDIRQTLLSSVTDQQKRLDDINAETSRRRKRLVSKIIDTQNKLKDLQAKLISIK